MCNATLATYYNVFLVNSGLEKIAYGSQGLAVRSHEAQEGSEVAIEVLQYPPPLWQQWIVNIYEPNELNYVNIMSVAGTERYVCWKPYALRPALWILGKSTRRLSKVIWSCTKKRDRSHGSETHNDFWCRIIPSAHWVTGVDASISSQGLYPFAKKGRDSTKTSLFKVPRFSKYLLATLLSWKLNI